MTETERKLKELEGIRQMIMEGHPDLNTKDIRHIMIITSYAAGFEIYLIAHASGVSEQTVYKLLRKLPMAYEAAKAKRAEIIQLRKKKKVQNSSLLT